MLAIEAVDRCIKNVFKGVKMRSIETLYEKIDGKSDALKLVFVLHQIDLGKQPIILTKFVFKTDVMKISLIEDSFTYLYDINCQYKQMFFRSEEELTMKLKTIVKKALFGPNVQALSSFMAGPATQINAELKKIRAIEHTVFNVKYDPKIAVLPCESQSFDFVINVNNAYDVEMNLRKIKGNDFTYTFEINKEYIKKDVHNLENIAGVVAGVLKTNLQA
jgi:hypothetical protein